MAYQFNDTVLENGFCQEIDTICGTTPISYSLARKARRLNAALDQFFLVSMKAWGTWSGGDSNASDLPIATTNIVLGQYDYGLNVSMIVIESVWIQNSTGTWIKLKAYDGGNLNPTVSGTPTMYAKSERSIIFDKIFSYAAVGGIKVYYQRALPRFVAADTTKTSGASSLFDMYLSRVASLPYLIEKGLKNKNDTANLILKDEILIESYFSLRQRDVRRQMKTNYQGNNSSR